MYKRGIYELESFLDAFTSEESLKTIPHMGPKTLAILYERVHSYGWKFAWEA